jgi:hypothetical protein
VRLTAHACFVGLVRVCGWVTGSSPAGVEKPAVFERATRVLQGGKTGQLQSVLEKC